MLVTVFIITIACLFRKINDIFENLFDFVLDNRKYVRYNANIQNKCSERIFGFS